jgi:hypothetical protein
VVDIEPFRDLADEVLVGPQVSTSGVPLERRIASAVPVRCPDPAPSVLVHDVSLVKVRFAEWPVSHPAIISYGWDAWLPDYTRKVRYT